MIQLDRKIYNRASLKLSQEIEHEQELAMIGHPLGLPQKVTDNAKITKIEENKPHFQANLDAFHGNSGSPVFNPKTGEVMGMLTSGGRDFQFNKINMCHELYVHKENGAIERVHKPPECRHSLFINIT